jgi:hypothetical protein
MRKRGRKKWKEEKGKEKSNSFQVREVRRSGAISEIKTALFAI